MIDKKDTCNVLKYAFYVERLKIIKILVRNDINFNLFDA